MIEKLEEIFWESGKFVNFKNEYVNAKARGAPFQLVRKNGHINFSSKNIKKEVNANKKYANLDINAYCLGNLNKEVKELPVQFFKI